VPDDLVLFMHHVPYTHKLRNGKTVVQYIYDSHYDGAEAVAKWVTGWKALRGRLDDERHDAVLKQLEYQAGQAVVWRDAVTRWFHRTSGIADARGRVGRYPDRIEAESATLTGYVAAPVTPWEAGSGQGAVECKAEKCTATFRHTAAAGRYDVVIQYFDVNTGSATYRARLGSAMLAEWQATERLPTRRLDGTSSIRRVISGVTLRPGDAIEVEGVPEGGETAALDYVELIRSRDR
jgi:alpha-glucuronidase